MERGTTALGRMIQRRKKGWCGGKMAEREDHRSMVRELERVEVAEEALEGAGRAEERALVEKGGRSAGEGAKVDAPGAERGAAEEGTRAE